MFGQDAGPALVVTKDRLTRALACPAHRWGERTGERSGAAEFTMPLATGALVDVLFRQLVTIGSIDSPMADAMDGLCADSHRAPLVGWIEGLASAEQRELRSEVERQADGLRQRWPALDPSWLPRTQTPLRAVLAEGHVDLSVYVDLAIGRPAADVASVALVDVRSGGRHPGHRDDRHLCALVEALRSPAPPFAVATYYTKTGELDVDPVDSELLAAAARRCLVGIRAMDSLNRGEEPGRTDSGSSDSGSSDSGSSDSGSSDSGSCTKCALQLSGEPAAQTVPIGVMPSVVEARSESPSALIGYAQGQAA